MDTATTIFLFIVIPLMMALAIFPVAGYFILEAVRTYKRRKYLMSEQHRKYVEKYENKQH